MNILGGSWERLGLDNISRSIEPKSQNRDLGVKFQQVVVHSVENWEAEIASNSDSQETEWTITIMLD